MYNNPYANKSLQKIANVNLPLADKIQSQGYCLTDQDVPEVEKIDRLMLVLVRCGNGRFLCPIQDVTHFVGIIEEHAKLKEEKVKKPYQGDHIRDVSLAA